MTKVVIIGGGPGGYEAALVGSQLGGDVTLIERDGLGGAAVLSDCVPSKTLIATAEVMVRIENARHLGLHIEGEARRPAQAPTQATPTPPAAKVQQPARPAPSELEQREARLRAQMEAKKAKRQDKGKGRGR